METLRARLLSLDRRPYPAYKDIRGRHGDPPLELYIDHVQGDPFAAPSRIRIRIHTSWPEKLIDSPTRLRALEDFLQRRVAEWIHRHVPGRVGSGKSGVISIPRPGQQILKRNGVMVTPDWVEVRLSVGLPAQGRRILGRAAAGLLADLLPRLARSTLEPANTDGKALQKHMKICQDSHWLRSQLKKNDLVVFVADGALLPRRSGIDPRPMDRDARLFTSPESLRRRFTMPSGKSIMGMAIPRGVTLIVGGGYHGKSTLLSAIERGVYDHIPGDGRELCVSLPTTMKIRAEEGRRVASVDISSFILDLPTGRSTTDFSTEDASGSTSQAAGLVEAMEAGSQLLLVDEDSAATNFMIRDRRMQALVHREHEPIVPFVDRVQELYRLHGISTILVIGGSGDYLDVADLVISMESFEPRDVTKSARDVAARYPTGRTPELPGPLGDVPHRVPDPGSIDPSRGRKSVSISARRKDTISFGREEIDIGSLSGPTELAQVRAIGDALHRLAIEHFKGGATIREALDLLATEMDTYGLDILRPGGFLHGEYAEPRIVDVAAALNRLRTLRIELLKRNSEK